MESPPLSPRHHHLRSDDWFKERCRGELKMQFVDEMRWDDPCVLFAHVLTYSVLYIYILYSMFKLIAVYATFTPTKLTVTLSLCRWSALTWFRGRKKTFQVINDRSKRKTKREWVNETMLDREKEKPNKAHEN